MIDGSSSKMGRETFGAFCMCVYCSSKHFTRQMIELAIYELYIFF